MKNYNIKFADIISKLSVAMLYLGISMAVTSCFDLNKEPEGVLSSVNAFTTTGEIRNYLDQFYETGVKIQGLDAGGGHYIAGSDTRSDNLSSNSVDIRLAGESTLSNARKLDEYYQIRAINFLLANKDNCTEKGNPLYEQYIGEAYYFRAWFYYKLLINYGPVAWVDVPLDPDNELMKLPREKRTVIADHILDDLDTAIGLLLEKSSSASMRVHRDVARILQSEVALFEGTWEKYHKEQNDPFYEKTITDAKINEYFTKAANAAKAVIDRGAWSIYSTGKPLDDYRVLFATTDLSNNKEVLWFKKYDGDQVGNNVNRYLNQGGGGIGVTASLVDDYLTIDGRPFIGEQKLKAKTVFGNELNPVIRDPRLSQTVCMPGQQLRPDELEPYSFPPLIGSSAYNQNVTGYSLLKYVQIDYTGSLDAEFKGATPGIQFRYADALLNYAEALAELDGAANESKIIEALHPLRKRVGMPDVDFNREYNTEGDYPFKNLDKYVQVVRRERRIEKACEGERLLDILRWAAADELIVGKWATGVLFIGSNLENNSFYGGNLIYDQESGSNLFLTGKPGDKYRYVMPSDRRGYANGWQFKLNRDYLLPIQERMIQLTNSLWTQNPNW